MPVLRLLVPRAQHEREALQVLQFVMSDTVCPEASHLP